MTSLALRAA